MKWSNWSGSVECTPADIKYPQSQDEIIAIVKECRTAGKSLRMVGSGHSFTSLVATNGVIVNLEKYQGVEQVNGNEVTLKAGTTIHALGEILFNLGLGQENLGDIDKQSIAGAISTGTHGSGITLGSIATQVTGLTLITANGEVIECSETQNREIFKAAQVSIGALGIISKVTLRALPAYTLDYRWEKLTLQNCLENLEKYKLENRHFEFFWIPHTEYVLAKFMNVTQEKPRPKNMFRQFNEAVLENGVFWMMCEMAKLRPSMSKSICRTTASLITSGHDIQYSHKIFATPRIVKFQEMEYNIPAEHFATVMTELKNMITAKDVQVNFPIECRFVRRDDIYLSPAYERDAAYLAVHMYKGMEYRPYFEAAEAIFKKYQGRPHWGKMHNLTTRDFQQLYPKWEAFQSIRQQLDPDGFFLNDHLRQIFCT